MNGGANAGKVSIVGGGAVGGSGGGRGGKGGGGRGVKMSEISPHSEECAEARGPEEKLNP